ncbi:MAG: hypothetical protein K2V38_21830, partial [Gemmataceae bacterium]|nr:hypothetical protein [Gemmataceae bacterium]
AGARQGEGADRRLTGAGAARLVKRAKKPKPETAHPPGARPARAALKAALGVAVAALVVFGVWQGGELARRSLGPRDRYAVPFADVRCDAPPGTSRETFLAEVRYASGAGPTVRLLDPDLTRTLTAAFAAHPWVARVDGVAVEPPGVVAVALTFRPPVLVDRQPDGPPAIDAAGVLRPAGAPTTGLPELLNVPSRPPGASAGQPWPESSVVRAAAVAAEYRPLTIAPAPQGWELVMPDKRRLLVGK